MTDSVEEPDLRRTVGDLGELALVERVCARLPVRGDIIVGAGDDCAVVRPSPDAGEDLVLKSDPVICGRHFLPDADPFSVGHKAVGRVLSDLAAMGAEPRWGVLNLVLPREIPVGYVDRMYEGILALAGRHGLAIVGGDTSQGTEVALHLFACGTVPRGQALLRSSAKPRDGVYVTGSLGGSLAGHHLNFEPRVAQGLWLRSRVHAMIDISDGLASELWHIAKASKVGVLVDAKAIPVSEAARETRSPLESALYDGEDFELLFTVAESREAEMEKAWSCEFRSIPCTRIGRVVSSGPEGVDEPCEAGVLLERGGTVQPLPRGGFEHFRK